MESMIRILLAILASSCQVQSACRPGWNNWGGRCYYMSTSTKNCTVVNGAGQEINELVYSNVPGPTKCYWIGISDIEHEDKYVYASDDKPVLWTNFRPGFPVSNSSRNCLLYSCDRSYPFQFWDYGCEVAIRYVCEELAGNSDCGVPDTYMVEESFKTADVESCRSICKSISTCTFFTFSAQTLACGIKTYNPGGMIDFKNIETGSPFMSGSIRNKIYVGKHGRKQSSKECQRSCQRDPQCSSWTWSTPSHGVPFICSHNYGEVRGKVSVPGSGVVSGPRCCHGDCQPPARTLAEKAEENHVEYLLLETDPDPNPDLEESPSLGIAHQDHGMFVFEEYEKDQQISLGNPPSAPSKDRQISIDKIDEWILTGVKKVFEPKSKTKN